MTKSCKTYLLTGANLGDRFSTLQRASVLLEERIGKLLQKSAVYLTAAWGNVDQPDYLNQALELETTLSPQELLQVTQKIENTLGRTERTKWGSRPIDIDILFYGETILKTKTLTLPHPHLQRRNFVLIPMLEIAPELLHPVFKKTIEELYIESQDELDVILVEPETAI